MWTETPRQPLGQGEAGGRNPLVPVVPRMGGRARRAPETVEEPLFETRRQVVRPENRGVDPGQQVLQSLCGTRRLRFPKTPRVIRRQFRGAGRRRRRDGDVIQGTEATALRGRVSRQEGARDRAVHDRGEGRKLRIGDLSLRPQGEELLGTHQPFPVEPGRDAPWPASRASRGHHQLVPVPRQGGSPARPRLSVVDGHGIRKPELSRAPSAMQSAAAAGAGFVGPRAVRRGPSDASMNGETAAQAGIRLQVSPERRQRVEPGPAAADDARGALDRRRAAKWVGCIADRHHDTCC